MRKIALADKAALLLAAFLIGLTQGLHADVVVLKNGVVLTGKVLQQDASGVLLELDSGTYNYASDWIKEVKRDPVVASPAAGNSQAIPDWASIVSRLADTGWAPQIKQVPATVITYGNFKNVPYVSFRCAYGAYAVNIYGDLDHPAAVQAGALNQFKDNSVARSNCVSFICSVLGNAEAKKMVSGLNLDQKDVKSAGDLTAEILVPGDMGSYGGWWVSVYNPAALVEERASDAEMLALTEAGNSESQPAIGQTTNSWPATNNSQPVADSGQITTYGTYTLANGWTLEELAAARRAAVTLPAQPNSRVYPRTYIRQGGTYGRRRR